MDDIQVDDPRLIEKPEILHEDLKRLDVIYELAEIPIKGLDIRHMKPKFERDMRSRLKPFVRAVLFHEIYFNLAHVVMNFVAHEGHVGKFKSAALP